MLRLVRILMQAISLDALIAAIQIQLIDRAEKEQIVPINLLALALIPIKHLLVILMQVTNLVGLIVAIRIQLTDQVEKGLTITAKERIITAGDNSFAD